MWLCVFQVGRVVFGVSSRTPREGLHHSKAMASLLFANYTSALIIPEPGFGFVLDSSSVLVVPLMVAKR